MSVTEYNKLYIYFKIRSQLWLMHPPPSHIARPQRKSETEVTWKRSGERNVDQTVVAAQQIVVLVYKLNVPLNTL